MDYHGVPFGAVPSRDGAAADLQFAAYRSSSPEVAEWEGSPAATLAAASAAEFFTGEYAAHTCQRQSQFPGASSYYPLINFRFVRLHNLWQAGSCRISSPAAC